MEIRPVHAGHRPCAGGSLRLPLQPPCGDHPRAGEIPGGLLRKRLLPHRPAGLPGEAGGKAVRTVQFQGQGLGEERPAVHQPLRTGSAGAQCLRDYGRRPDGAVPCGLPGLRAHHQRGGAGQDPFRLPAPLRGVQPVLCQAGRKEAGAGGAPGGGSERHAAHPEGGEAGGLRGQRLRAAQEERHIRPAHGGQRGLHLPPVHGTDFRTAPQGEDHRHGHPGGHHADCGRRLSREIHFAGGHPDGSVRPHRRRRTGIRHHRGHGPEAAGGGRQVYPERGHLPVHQRPAQ